MSLTEWKILEWDEKPQQTKKPENKKKNWKNI